MILLDCDRNSTNTNIFRSPVQQIVRNQSILRTTVFYKPFFELSVMRGNFFRWAGFGDIPSSHGDIPVVSFLMYEVESTKHIFFRVLRYFYPMEAFSRLLQVSKMQVFCLYVLYDRILFWREHTVYIGFRWRSRVSFDFLIQFSIFSNSMCLQIATIPANTVPDNFQLVYVWLWKAHVNFVQTFICHNTKVQPACR